MNDLLIKRVAAEYNARFGRKPGHIARAPGRVNLLGEHVDYNDGFVMPMAIDRATYVAFDSADGDTSTLAALDFAAEIELNPRSVHEKQQANSSPLPGWGLYPAGVMHILQQAGHNVVPIQAVYASDVPRGAGLSSSASVELALMTAFCALGDLPLTPMQQALLCQKAENEYVGVNCGIMDQFASACGVADSLLLLDCRSLDWRTYKVPKDVSIVIADTHRRRQLSSSAYNQRRQECEEALRLLKVWLPGITSLRDVSPENFDRFSHYLPVTIEKRARHVVEEIARTRSAGECLRNEDMKGFGELMYACHVSLRDLFEVSSMELETMTSIASSLEGCLGSRLTGAGFGGCTVSLVEKEKEAGFVTLLSQQYQQVTGITPEIYITSAADGAGLVVPQSQPHQ